MAINHIGPLADHLGRKKVFLVSRTVGALVLVPCAFLGPSAAVPWLFRANAVLASASWPCLDAMVIDLTRREERRAAFSLQYLGLNIGFAIGPTIAGFLYRGHLGDVVFRGLS
ncbi:MAG: MFS transporter [Firmicutes bacterium]|nr:MFS transporter [Bacillota bacterium]